MFFAGCGECGSTIGYTFESSLVGKNHLLSRRKHPFTIHWFLSGRHLNLQFVCFLRNSPIMLTWKGSLSVCYPKPQKGRCVFEGLAPSPLVAHFDGLLNPEVGVENSVGGCSIGNGELTTWRKLTKKMEYEKYTSWIQQTFFFWRLTGTILCVKSSKTWVILGSRYIYIYIYIHIY